MVCVRATRTTILGAVRTGGTGQLAPGPTHYNCAYGGTRTSLRARRAYTAYCVAPQVAHLSAACSSGAQFLTEHPLVGSAHGKRNAHGAPLGCLVSG